VHHSAKHKQKLPPKHRQEQITPPSAKGNWRIFLCALKVEGLESDACGQPGLPDTSICLHRLEFLDHHNFKYRKNYAV
jgi:hypothetical protein